MPSSLHNALKDIRALVIDAVASEGGVGSNVFVIGGVLDDPPMPHIVVADGRNSDEDFRTHDAGIKAETLDFALHIHTKGRDQGVTLRDHLANALAGLSGIVGDTTFGVVTLEGSTHFFNEKLRSNEHVLDFAATITNN